MKLFITLGALLLSGSLWAEERSAFFPNGGLDPFGYVYWWEVPPDSKPYDLASKGERDQAFSYCLNKIDQSTGANRVFYVVQASALGVGLKKPHLVAEKMASVVNKKVGVITSLAAYDKASPEDWLLLAYSISICDYLAGEPEDRYDAWREMSQQRAFRHRQHAFNFVQSTTFKSLGDRYLKATWAFLSGEYSIARKLMTDVAGELAGIPGPKLTLVRYWTYGSSRTGPSDDKIAKQLLGQIRRNWPNYDRALYFDGVYGVRWSNKALAKQLLERYLQMGTGPAYEKRSAKRALAEIG